MSRRAAKEPDEEPAWHRRPGESPVAYRAFEAYRSLGLGRSIEKVRAEHVRSRTEAGPKTTSVSVLKDWSAKWNWVERARAFDNHLAAERAKVAAQEAAKWERRRQDELETNYQIAVKFRVLVERAMKWPLERQRVENAKGPDGKVVPVLILEPARWTLRDLVAMTNLAAQLAAGCCAAAAKDPAGMGDDELDAIANAGFAAQPHDEG